MATVKNKSQLKTTTNSRVYHILSVIDQDPYSDDGLFYYQSSKNNKKKGKNYKKKEITLSKRREYKNWKYNRKTQFK